MASLELVKHLDYTPDILHCNDWQTALVPVFLNLFFRCFEKLRSIKTVFTIHNIQYQGRFGMEICGDLLGLPRHKEGIVEFDGCANYMKAAIDQSDRITTVSPTYAKEILDPWYAHGLDGLLRERQYKLSGILNGIDTDLYNPCLLYTSQLESHLMPGENRLAVDVAPGWRNNRGDYLRGVNDGREVCFMGEIALTALLKVFYTDGSVQSLSTDSSWEVRETPRTCLLYTSFVVHIITQAYFR